jgi:hypothetical protein
MHKNKKFRIIITLIVPVLSLIYGLGDYCNLWDHLSGRKVAMDGYHRLSQLFGPSGLIIKQGEPEYSAVYRILVKHTANEAVQVFHRSGERPHSITRVGGPIGSDLAKQIPEGWPDVRFVPGTLPLIFVYGDPRKGPGKAFRVGTLDELREWLAKSKATERFVVTTILIGLLSVILALLNVFPAKADS